MPILDLSTPVNDDVLKNLSAWFSRFSKQAVNSKMYSFLSEKIANDVEVLKISLNAPMSQPIPNLFFAAVHYLLLKNKNVELSKFYPSCGGSLTDLDLLWSEFRSFCLKNKDSIFKVMEPKLVQTNEVRRCGAIKLGVEQVAQRSGSRNISLLEIGASAGLNLLYDCYPIHYFKDESSLDREFQIDVQLKGPNSPNRFEHELNICDRFGVDLNPLNFNDIEDETWLKALVWPDQLERFEMLSNAIFIAKSHSVNLIKGSGLDFDLLSQIVKGFKKENTVCIFHSFTLNQFSQTQREEFDKICENISKDRDIWRLSFEWIGKETPELDLYEYKNGTLTNSVKLAKTHDHGRWIEWLSAS